MGLSNSAVSRTHRTAIFVDGAALASNSGYRERARRLEQSVNGKNIKADLYTVFNAAAGNAGIVKGLVTDVPPSTGFDGAAIEKIGREAGYVQTIVVFPTA